MSAQEIRDYHDKVLAAVGGTWFDFEGLVRDIYVAVLKPGDTALDVGVNEGVHFHQLRAAVGRSGRVIGIEAAPAMAEIVRRSLRRKKIAPKILSKIGLLRNNFVIHNVAVSNYNGTATFSFVKNSTGLSSLAKRDVATIYETEEITVPVTTIDDLLKTTKAPIAFTKMDIEGAEFHSLQGGLKIVNDRSPIVFEFDRDTPRHFGFDVEDMISFFKSYDYEISDFFGNVFVTGDELLQSGVWNYYAGPKNGFGRTQVRESVYPALSKVGIPFPPLGS